MNDLILYTTEDGRSQIKLRAKDQTVWLTQREMAQLFDVSTDNVGLHLKNIFEDGELSREATTKESSVVQTEEGGRCSAPSRSTTSMASWPSDTACVHRGVCSSVGDRYVPPCIADSMVRPLLWASARVWKVLTSSGKPVRVTRACHLPDRSRIDAIDAFTWTGVGQNEVFG